jgi:hypothetical protein
LATADTITITDVGKLDVAIVSPGGVPGVLDQVVGLSVLGSITNGEDTVIKAGSAFG